MKNWRSSLVVVAALGTLSAKYWSNVYAENPKSFGGFAGSSFSPAARDWIQQHLPGTR